MFQQESSKLRNIELSSTVTITSTLHIENAEDLFLRERLVTTTVTPELESSPQDPLEGMVQGLQWTNTEINQRDRFKRAASTEVLRPVE